MIRRYTIAGESNPVWQIVEPRLLELWAEGILRTSYARLYLVTAMGVAVSLGMFVLSFTARSVLLALLFALVYVAFEDRLIQVVGSVVVLPEGISLQDGPPKIDDLWIDQVAGYFVLITSCVLMLAVLGRRLIVWVRDLVIYMLLIITFMVPLRLLARGLLRESYVAQTVAKLPFMGQHIAGTVAALPSVIQERYDHLVELYRHSNDAAARQELERICGESHDARYSGL